MKTNKAGVDLIKSFESLRLNAYQDSGGVWTCGYGSTKSVHPGMTITEEQADELLRQDLAEAEFRVCRLVKVPMTDNQFAALVSFTFNVGAGNLQSSSLLRLLNAGDVDGAALQFLAWDHVNGVKCAGLLRRRQAEQALFQAA